MSRTVLSLTLRFQIARLIRAFREAACVKMRKNLEMIFGKKEARNKAAHVHLHDVRTDDK